jgi:hypothetical protein
MIDNLDDMLRYLFVSTVPGISSDTQVGFRPPDDDWRTEVLNLQQMALNVYLVDLRENRKLRSNARQLEAVVDGDVVYRPAPARVDCHYLITAWSPAQPNPAVEPTVDEHALIYQVMASLMNHAPLDPRRIYGEGNPILAGLPSLFLEAMPTQVLPVEGFLKQPEFWGTMGLNHRWRPALYLVITLPLALRSKVAGPPVTTRAAGFGRADQPGVGEVLYQVAGTVWDVTGVTPSPVADAWIRLLDDNGRPLRSLRTGSDGRFRFDGLIAGPYQLEWRATGFPPPAAQPITVPSPTGEYDLRFV